MLITNSVTVVDAFVCTVVVELDEYLLILNQGRYLVQWRGERVYYLWFEDGNPPFKTICIQSWKTGWNFMQKRGGGLSLEATVYPLLVGPEFCFVKSDNSMSVVDSDLGIYLFYFYFILIIAS